MLVHVSEMVSLKSICHLPAVPRCTAMKHALPTQSCSMGVKSQKQGSVAAWEQPSAHSLPWAALRFSVLGVLIGMDSALLWGFYITSFPGFGALEKGMTGQGALYQRALGHSLEIVDKSLYTEMICYNLYLFTPSYCSCINLPYIFLFSIFTHIQRPSLNLNGIFVQCVSSAKLLVAIIT